VLRTLQGWWSNAMDALGLMWTEPFSYLIFAATVVAIVVSIRRSGRLQPLRHLAMAGLGVWLVAAFAMTIYPIELEPPAADRLDIKSAVPLWGTIESFANADGYFLTDLDWATERQRLADSDGVPVEEIRLERKVRGVGLSGALKDPLGNVVLFAPLGFLAPLVWTGMRDPKRILLAGVCVSGGIELSQLLFGLGSLGTIDDVIFNSLGALIGWVGWWVITGSIASVRANLR
jgi:hypothetical protein